MSEIEQTKDGREIDRNIEDSSNKREDCDPSDYTKKSPNLQEDEQRKTLNQSLQKDQKDREDSDLRSDYEQAINQAESLLQQLTQFESSLALFASNQESILEELQQEKLLGIFDEEEARTKINGLQEDYKAIAQEYFALRRIPQAMDQDNQELFDRIEFLSGLSSPLSPDVRRQYKLHLDELLVLKQEIQEKLKLLFVTSEVVHSDESSYLSQLRALKEYFNDAEKKLFEEPTHQSREKTDSEEGKYLGEENQAALPDEVSLVEDAQQAAMELEALFERLGQGSEEEGFDLLEAYPDLNSEITLFYGIIAETEGRIDGALRPREAAEKKQELENMREEIKSKAVKLKHELIKSDQAYKIYEEMRSLVNENESLRQGYLNVRALSQEGVGSDTIDAIELISESLQRLRAIKRIVGVEDRSLADPFLDDVTNLLDQLKQYERYYNLYLNFRLDSDNQALIENLSKLFEADGSMTAELRQLVSDQDIIKLRGYLENFEQAQQRLEREREDYDSQTAARIETNKVIRLIESALPLIRDALVEIEQEQLENFNHLDQIKAIIQSIEAIEAIDVESVRQDENQTESLRNLKDRLEQAVSNAERPLNPGAEGVFGGNELVILRIEEINKKIEAALAHVGKAIEASQEAVRIRKELEEVYGKLYAFLKPSNNPEQKDKREKIEELAAKIGEEERWANAIKLYDALLSTGENYFDKQLAFSDEIGAWKKIAEKISLEKMRSLEQEPEISRVADVLEIIFAKGSNYYSEVQQYLLQNGLEVNQELSPDICKWNYCLKGEPEEGDQEAGHKKITELLAIIFPEYRSSSIQIGVDLATATGLRSREHFKYLYAYSASPKSQFGVKGVAKLCAPLAYIMYYVRKKPWAPIDLRDLLVYYDPYLEGEAQVAGSKMRLDKNAKLWVKFKERIRDLLTEADLSQLELIIEKEDEAGNPVEVREEVLKKVNLNRWSDDLQIFPVPWDLLRSDNLKNLTMEYYVDGIEAFSRFIEKIRQLADKKYPDNDGEQNVAVDLGDLGDLTAPIKNIINPLRETVFFERYKQLIVFLHLVALKRLFTAYSKAEMRRARNSIKALLFIESPITKLQDEFAKAVESGVLSGSVVDFVQESVTAMIDLSRRPLRAVFSSDSKTIPDIRTGLEKELKPDEYARLLNFLSQKVDEEAKKE